jgi:hypothetical protein
MDTMSEKCMNMTFTVKLKRSQYEGCQNSFSQECCCRLGSSGCGAKMKALRSFQTSRITHTVKEGHTPEDCNLQHETPRNKQATE